jgi:thiol-disulfide isomerase/thioredoxin
MEPNAPSTGKRLLVRSCILMVFVLVFVLGKFALERGIMGGQVARANEPELVASDFQPEKREAGEARAEGEKRIPAPELDGGTAWLNTAKPIHIRDLRGKVVLLDFWTLCCINCIHTLPDLARLEKKYANQLVVIGVHSPKFDNEHNTESIRKAILRYEVAHPVVNDADMKIWRSYQVTSWPTLWLIDPEGMLVAKGSGEGLGDAVDRAIAQLVKVHRGKKTLNEGPLHFDLARKTEPGESPLYFPGKVLADAASDRLFIADSTHHRIVITDLHGKKIAIAGNGAAGFADGAFAAAQFNDPQGMALDQQTLYVADRKNHRIRALDLKQNTVRTIAGNGEKGNERVAAPALSIGLNSPWDLCLIGSRLFIAMAGHHQIWDLNLASGTIGPFAGTGAENIQNGSPGSACFAQPSGLTTDGTTLFVADSEVSAIRAVPLDGKGEVRSLVGEGLFDFGDVDGIGSKARLQHALGVAFHEGMLYVADTYNSKIKTIDPARSELRTFVGGFNEPGGLSFAGNQLFVADTNNHRIAVVDVKTRAVSSLNLQGVEAPASLAAASVKSSAKQVKP